MWYFGVFLLCSLFISFLTSFTIFVSEVVTTKYTSNGFFDSKDFIQCSLLGLIPILNIIMLGCAAIDIIDTFLKRSGYVESVNKYITSLIKGENK